MNSETKSHNANPKVLGHNGLLRAPMKTFPLLSVRFDAMTLSVQLLLIWAMGAF